jgi:acetyl-CoA carboxylase biotin carboxyl carrier protein
MELTRLKALIDLVSQSKVSELEITEGGERVRITKSSPVPERPSAPSDVTRHKSTALRSPPDQPQAQERTESPPSAHAITSPMYGIFHQAQSPDSPPYVQTGSQVRTGDPLCLIEAMKSFNVIAADRNGTVGAILVENGQEVELGQILFEIGG